MVSTRSGRTGNNMEEASRTTGVTGGSVSIPVVTTASVTAGDSTARANIAPSVQQFMTSVQDRANHSREESQSYSGTISSPEYSSVTARNIQQEFRPNRGSIQPAQVEGARGAGDPTAGISGDIAGLIQRELAKQMQSVQLALQQQVSLTLNRALDRQTDPNNRPLAQNVDVGAQDVNPPVSLASPFQQSGVGQQNLLGSIPPQGAAALPRCDQPSTPFVPPVA